MAQEPVTFTERETEALQGIVIDWIGERVLFPPYPDEIEAVIRKLRIPEEAVRPHIEPAPLRANQA